MANKTPDSELIGKRFGRLIIDQFVDSIRSGGQMKRRVLAACECGTQKIFFLSSLTRGLTKSCGCYRSLKSSSKNFKHGLIKTDLYSVLAGMKRRCYNKKEISYKYYGAVGIKVCDEWRNDFMAFYNWAVVNGYKKGLQIDRKNGAGDYEPGNCRWVTSLVNSRNRSITKIIDCNGQSKSAGEWAEITGVNYGTLVSRINRGKMTASEALIPYNPI